MFDEKHSRTARDQNLWKLQFAKSTPLLVDGLKSDEEFLRAYKLGVSRCISNPHPPEKPGHILAWRELRPKVINAFYSLYSQSFPRKTGGDACLQNVELESPLITVLQNSPGQILTCLVSARDSLDRFVALSPGIKNDATKNEKFPGTLIRHPEAVKTRLHFSLRSGICYSSLLYSPHALYAETKFLHKISIPDWSPTRSQSRDHAVNMPYVGKIIRQSIDDCIKRHSRDPEQEGDHQELVSLNPVWPSTDDMIIREITKPNPWQSVARVAVDEKLFSVNISLSPDSYEISATAKLVD